MFELVLKMDHSQVAAENYLTRLMEDCSLVATHAKRVTIR
jgi:histone H3/H4